MSETIKAFLNSIAYHVGDVPMLDIGEAQRTIDEWKEEGMKVPSDLDASVLYSYYQDTLCERYPVSYEPLAPELDALVYEFLCDEGWDFRDGLDEEIDYINAWYSVNDWIGVKNRDGEKFPQFLTPDVFMRYVNCHHKRIASCFLYIVTFERGEENWHGPYNSLTFAYESANGIVHYTASDYLLSKFDVRVSKYHEIMTRSN